MRALLYFDDTCIPPTAVRANSFFHQDALSWGGALDEELRRAATTLNLSQIVQRYHVTGFNLVDAARATRLLRLATETARVL